MPVISGQAVLLLGSGAQGSAQGCRRFVKFQFQGKCTYMSTVNCNGHVMNEHERQNKNKDPAQTPNPPSL